MLREIVAVGRAQRIAITNHDEVCQLTTLLDSSGEETNDIECAVIAIGKLDDANWFTIDLREFDTVGTH